MKTISAFVLSVAAAAVLTACGGGGGGSTASNGGTTVPPVVTPPPVTNPITPASLQLTVPTPTYAAGSVELPAFARLNELRQKYGFGLLKQDAALDIATKSHLAYSVANNSFDHIENPALPSYYAASPSDRAVKAGYGSVEAGEVMAIGVPGVAAVDDLFNTILHRSVMLDQAITDVGVAGYVQGSFTPTIIDLGRRTKQNNASDFVTTVPMNQDSNVPLSMGLESPSPFADVPTAQLPTNTTSPVSVFVAAGKTLTVTTFTVTEHGQATPLDVRLITSANDPTHTLSTNEAHVSGKVPFKPNTTYDVVFAGSASGAAITKQWSFVTGMK